MNQRAGQRRGGRGQRRAALLLTLAALLAAAPLLAAAEEPVADEAASEVLGNWLTADHDGIIAISRAPDGHYEGLIVGGDSPTRMDDKNPDPSRRGDKLLGLTILRNMRYDGHGRWSGGTIYDPDSGHTYRCRLQLLGADRLRVRGFLGVAMLGRSQVWTRYRGSSLQLPHS